MRSKAYKMLSKRSDNLYPALGDLDKLSTDELRGLRAVCGMVNDHNCSWTAFALAPLLLEEIKAEFMRRAFVRQSKRKRSQSTSKGVT